MKQLNARQLIRELNIQSYASPDGGIDINERLASQRESATTSYLRNQLAKKLGNNIIV